MMVHDTASKLSFENKCCFSYISYICMSVSVFVIIMVCIL